MSVLNEGQLLGAPGSSQYQIQRSLRFNSADSAYLSRTPASAGNRKTWTWSGWVKRSGLGATLEALFGNPSGVTETTYARLIFNNDCLQFGPYTTWWRITTRVFRDPSAWYHIVLAFDTTQATAANRVKLYVNGVEETTFSTSTDPALNTDYAINNTAQHEIGRSSGNGLFNGYLADIHFIDGQALTPSSFGETDATTGQWIPKAYTGTYGTNGFKLNFSNNSAATATTLGADSSGNGNNWTPNNLSVTAGAGNDSLVDTPTSYGTDTGVGGEVRGNYCTLNPLVKVNSTATPTISEGNLKIAPGGTGDNYYVGTQTLTGGKFYYEVTIDDVGGGVLIGVCPTSAYTTTAGTPGTYRNTGVITDFAGTSVTSGSTFTTGDVIGVAVDIDAGTVKFYKNNAGQGATPSFSFTAGTPVVARGRFDQLTGALTANFGQRPFAYTAPSGFKALCDTNLPAPTIVKPSTVMDVKLYTGNSSTQTISGLGFSPDLVWSKSRNVSQNHRLYDVIRGADKVLFSSTTDAESTDATQLTSFNSDGFALGAGGSNTSGNTYAAWCWDAGSSTVTNTAGTISSQVRANASAGFSIVTYTGNGTAGATIGHGLGVVPQMIITKPRSAANGWLVYHQAIGNTAYLALETTGGSATSSAAWNNTTPSSTVFTAGSGAGINQNTTTYVAYCFAPVAGCSAFGSYTGNGSADGPFVYTGFRPRWVMVKCSSAVTNWRILDAARDTYNAAGAELYPNLSNQEQGGINALDLTSNGFKIRINDPAYNTNAGTYVYAAFAEFPFQYARAR